MKVIYEIIFANGKIYVGKDVTDSILYFGSPSPAAQAAMQVDFPRSLRTQFTVTREILWQSENATLQEVNRMEIQFIRSLRSNDPNIGYNLWPRA